MERIIGFNKPYLTGNEVEYIKQAAEKRKLSGNGFFTQKCHEYFRNHYGFKKCFLTTSCTDALEMAAILMNVGADDEIIIPSFTFVSTANAFVLRGATIVFADSRPDHPNIDADELAPLITSKTKAIVVVHYAGMACDMDKIMKIAEQHNLFVVEDAAQSIDNYYKGRPLGSIGHFGAFSFHETKNIICGEGGMLVINDPSFNKRADIVWEKGTNRVAYFNGEIDKYGWVGIGSSFLPSEIVAAFLYAQLEHISEIQEKRKQIWNTYYRLKALSEKYHIHLPVVPAHSSNNYHMFYLICNSAAQRTELVSWLRLQHIDAPFHYQSLHRSDFFHDKHDGRVLAQSDRYSDCLIRLPFYYELSTDDQEYIICKVKRFFYG